MLMLQDDPTCDHLVQLYDWFIMEEQDILIMEYPHPCMTLFNYIQQNRGHLTKAVARRIMRQLLVALLSCNKSGVSHFTYTGNILLNTETLHLKLIGFGSAQIISGTGELHF